MVDTEKPIKNTAKQKEARLANALRDNLHRRKQQQRDRIADTTPRPTSKDT